MILPGADTAIIALAILSLVHASAAKLPCQTFKGISGAIAACNVWEEKD